jgi:hypothetical protein
MYEEMINEELGGMTIRYTEDSGKVWSIPADPSNRMYQEYLLWKFAQPISPEEV